MKDFMKMLYVAIFVMAPVFSNKILDIHGVTLPAGMFFVVLIMLGLVDLINYTMGAKEARKMLLQALVIKALVYLALVPLAIYLPGAKFWQGQEVYTQFLHESVRLFLAGELIILVGQYYLDIPIFNAFKKLPWVARVMASDFVSQAVQTVGFLVLAFYGKPVPLVEMIVSAYLFRIVLSLLKALLYYPLARGLRNGGTSKP